MTQKSVSVWSLRLRASGGYASRLGGFAGNTAKMGERLNRLSNRVAWGGSLTKERTLGTEVVPVEHYLVGCSIGCFSVQLC